jgi:hypothetical protein
MKVVGKNMNQDLAHKRQIPHIQTLAPSATSELNVLPLTTHSVNTVPVKNAGKYCKQVATPTKYFPIFDKQLSIADNRNITISMSAIPPSNPLPHSPNLTPNLNLTYAQITNGKRHTSNECISIKREKVVRNYSLSRSSLSAEVGHQNHSANSQVPWGLPQARSNTIGAGNPPLEHEHRNVIEVKTESSTELAGKNRHFHVPSLLDASKIKTEVSMVMATKSGLYKHVKHVNLVAYPEMQKAKYALSHLKNTRSNDGLHLTFDNSVL